MRGYRTMDYIRNTLANRSHLHPEVVREDEAWRAHAARRVQGVEDLHATGLRRLRVRQETVVQRLVALGQFHERTRNLIREGGQNTARFARESARLSQELVEAVEAMSNLLDRYVDAIHTVTRQREDLKIESHNAQVLAQTLAAQFEGARGIARVKGRDVEALTLVVQHAQREIDTLVRENAELRVSLELEKSATQTVAEDWDEVRQKFDQSQAQLAATQAQLAAVQGQPQQGQAVAPQVQVAQAQVREVHAPLQPKASVRVGYGWAVLENVHVKAGAEYLIGTESGQSPFRWMLNVDLGLNKRIRGNGLFAGVSSSTRGVTGSYEMAQLNGELFHSIKADVQLPPGLMAAYPSLGHAAGIGLLTPVRRDLSPANALRQGQIELTNRVFDARKPGLQVHQTITVKHAPQPTVRELPPARVRASDNGYAFEDRKPDVVVVEPAQLAQPPTAEVRPTSPNAGTGSTDLNLVLGLAASLLVLRTLFKKFKRNKRTP